MLTTLRNSAQSWLIKGLLGIIVITFIVSFGVGTFSNPKEVLVEVGDTEILVTEFMRQYQEELERLRQRFPGNAEALAAQLNLRSQVLERMVNRHLLLQAARAQGLAISESEVKDAVTRTPAFQVNGSFDFHTYRQILAQNSLTPAGYEADLRNDLLLAKQERNLIAGVIVSPQEVEQRYRIENERVEVDYAYVDPLRVTPGAQPDAAELRAFYEAHPDQFTQPAQFKLRYFALSLDDVAQDVEIRDRAVERYYERNAETEFATPARVRASHILIRLPKDAGPEQEAQARARLQALLEKARGGADFARLARENSQDFSAEKGGDLGLFTREDMVPAFADAAFALPKGGLSDVVRSPFGLHLIKATDVQPGTLKTLEEARGEIAAKLRVQRAERTLELEAERLPARLAKEGIEAVAKSFGKDVQATDAFDSAKVLPALGAAAPLYAQLARRKPGDAGVWRRNPVQGHVFYEVTDKQEAFTRPFDTVQGPVRQAVLEQKRRERAVTLAKEAFQKLQDGQRLETFARSLDLPVKTVGFTVVDSSIEGIGANREFQRAAFGLTAEQPYALNIKDEKAYLIRFKRRTLPEAEQAAEARRRVTARLQEAYQQYLLSAEIERLRAAVPVQVLAPEYVAAANAQPTPARRAN